MAQGLHGVSHNQRAASCTAVVHGAHALGVWDPACEC